ncbi:MAG: hypothetical protein ACRDU8_01495, partial [Egibacteraceae bacterium]
VQQCAVELDLERAAAGRDDDELVDVVAELAEQFGRQTGGPVFVASGCAVLDADAHAVLLAHGLR